MHYNYLKYLEFISSFLQDLLVMLHFNAFPTLDPPKCKINLIHLIHFLTLLFNHEITQFKFRHEIFHYKLFFEILTSNLHRIPNIKLECGEIMQ